MQKDKLQLPQCHGLRYSTTNSVCNICQARNTCKDLGQIKYEYHKMLKAKQENEEKLTAIKSKYKGLNYASQFLSARENSEISHAREKNRTPFRKLLAKLPERISSTTK